MAQVLVSAQYAVHVDIELDLDILRETHEEMHENGEVSTLLADSEWEELAKQEVRLGLYVRVPLAIQSAIERLVRENVEPASGWVVNGAHTVAYEALYDGGGVTVLEAESDPTPKSYPLVMGTRKGGE